MHPKFTAAIVPSAGVGLRFGPDGNKNFYTLGGLPIVLLVLETLAAVAEIDEIVPVFGEDDMARGMKLVEESGIGKIRMIAPGGQTRQESVFHALKLIAPRLVQHPDAVVLIHDGARPLVTRFMIEESLRLLVEGVDGVICAVTPKDTIKLVDAGLVKKTLNRSELVNVQTPQVFRLKALLSAHERASKGGREFTDDAAVLENARGRVRVIEGDYENIKITTRHDLQYAEFVLAGRRRKEAEAAAGGVGAGSADAGSGEMELSGVEPDRCGDKWIGDRRAGDKSIRDRRKGDRRNLKRTGR
jgi:2-C-methyl-D-erythritol 4-phosphate cytidylyltransferase